MLMMHPNLIRLQKLRQKLQNHLRAIFRYND